MVSLDTPEDADLVDAGADIAAGFIPGVGSALGARDVVRGYREGDPIGMALGAAGMIPVVGGASRAVSKALRRAPQDEALETARKNAVKMLGLPENNTAMDRARAMGFTPAYHGTADDVQRIDPSKFGSSTGAQSAKKAFWAVDDPTTARGYAEYAASDAKVKRVLDAADKAQMRGDWNKYDDLVRQAEELESVFAKNPLQGQNIMPLMLRANKGVRGVEMDAKGAEFVDLEGGVNKLLNEAVKGKRDLAVIRNLSDDVGRNNRPATHYAAINPSIVRSRFAAFDPARVNENDLLGRADPRLLAIIAGGGLTGLTVNALRNKRNEEKSKEAEAR